MKKLHFIRAVRSNFIIALCFIPLLLCCSIESHAIQLDDSGDTIYCTTENLYYIKSDGSLYSRGDNQLGGLGIGAAEWTGTGWVNQGPANSVKAMEHCRAILTDDHSGYRPTYVVKEDGTTWTFGCDQSLSRSVFANGSVLPTKLPDDVVCVAEEKDVYAHVLFFVKADGTLWGCGVNEYGELLNGNCLAQQEPIIIMDGVADVYTVDQEGRLSVYVIKNDGSLWAWGYNKHGELGIGNAGSTVTEPQFVTNDVRSFKAEDGVAPSFSVIKTDGSLWSWGFSILPHDGYDHTVQFGSSVGVGAKYHVAYKPVKIYDGVVYNTVDAFGQLFITEDSKLLIWGLEKTLCPESEEPVELMGNVADVLFLDELDSWDMKFLFVLQKNGALMAYGKQDGWSQVLDNVVSISGEYDSIAALKSDGSLWTYGKSVEKKLAASGFLITPFTCLDTGIMLPSKAPSSGEVPASSKPDEPSDWAKAEVSAAIDSGLVPENLQHDYTKPVSRADVAQMFVNLIERSSGMTIDAFLAQKGVEINPDAFTDTTDKAVLACNAFGIINGVGNNAFAPNGTFTRGQIAAILNRIAGTLGIDTSGYTHNFTDVAGHWCSAELGWPVQAGIINGVGNNKFDPEGALTTEQAIAMVVRAYRVLK